MKVLLKRTLKSLKRDTGAGIKELQEGYEPFKPAIQFLKLAVSCVIALAGMWSASPTLAITFIVVGIVILVLIWRKDIATALRGDKNDLNTRVNRDLLLSAPAAASVGMLFWAMLAPESSTPCFFAGILIVVSLQAAKARFAAEKVQSGFAHGLVESLIEPLRIFTAIAGAYTICSLALDFKLEFDGITLAQLKFMDRLVLHARNLLDHLHFSALGAFGSAALLLFLRWTVRRRLQRSPRSKWTIRVAIAALCIASFSLLAVHQHGVRLAAALREFKYRYSELRDSVDSRIDQVFKRALIGTAWTQMDETDREQIRGAVRNRKAVHNLEEGYQALSGLGLRDPQTAAVIATMRVPDVTPDRPASRVAPDPPAGLERVSLYTVRIASMRAAPGSESNKGALPASIDEVEEMASSITPGILEIAADKAASYQPLFHWFNAHFPGLEEILNSIADADRASLVEAWKQTRDHVIRRFLASPHSNLVSLVENEGPPAAARLRLHPPRLSDHSRSLSVERDTIRQVETALRFQAAKTMEVVWRASKVKTDRMAVQLKALDERFPNLHIATSGFDRNSEFGPTPQWAFAALRRSTTEEAQLSSLDKLKTFAGPDALGKLRQQLETEQHHENLLIELVGQGGLDESALQSILGPDLDRYTKIYKDRLYARILPLL